jgi:hypothetical protein
MLDTEVWNINSALEGVSAAMKEYHQRLYTEGDFSGSFILVVWVEGELGVLVRPCTTGESSEWKVSFEAALGMRSGTLWLSGLLLTGRLVGKLQALVQILVGGNLALGATEWYQRPRKEERLHRIRWKRRSMKGDKLACLAQIVKREDSKGLVVALLNFECQDIKAE